MKTEYKDKRVNTKLNETDYLRLQSIASQYGFRSAYQVVQALIQVLLRTVDAQKDCQYIEGIPVELSQIVTDALNAQRRADKRSKK